MPIVACAACGARNRVEDRGSGVKPVCGRCGGPLAPAARPIIVDEASFPQQVLQAGAQPVLVDFWAEWCPPCRALAPTLERLAAQAGGRYRIAKVDIDRNPSLAAQYRVQSVPTMLIFKHGQLVDELVGVQPEAQLRARLEAHV